jgi:hypothetical protein
MIQAGKSLQAETEIPNMKDLTGFMSIKTGATT